jgi:hypothetical protein
LNFNKRTLIGRGMPKALCDVIAISTAETHSMFIM